LIVVIGRSFLDRTSPTGPDYVVEEIGGALERSLDIVPVLVHGAEMPAPEALPERIRELAFRQAARVRSDPDFAADAETLLRALSARVLDAPGGPRGAGNAEPLRVTVHVARFVKTNTPCCFINVTNLTPSDVEVTHVWIDSTPPAFPTTPDRPLPTRLRPQESWETWIPLAELPAQLESEALHRMARARLSTGAIVASVANDSVPARGSVAGGPISEIP
jgi:hypothetical protein